MRAWSLIIAALCLISSNSSAQSDNLGVEWNLPQSIPSPQGKLLRIILSGVASGGARITIGESLMWSSGSGKYLEIPTAGSILGKSSVQTNETGFFEFTLDLERGRYQIPVSLEIKGGRRRVYRLSIEVTDVDVIIMGGESFKADRKKFSLWLSAGLNYLFYSQYRSDFGSELTYNSLAFPAYSVEAQMRVTEGWRSMVSFRSSPGAVSSGRSTTVSDGTYEWTILSLDLQYSPRKWRKRIWNIPMSFGWRVGPNRQEVPVLTRTGDSSAEIQKGEITMLTAGPQMDVRLTREWNFEAFMRFQQPISSGGFTITPSFAFDGSIGAYYNFGSDWTLGGFWLGQWQNYSFQHAEPYNGQSLSGEQKLLFSNLEIRGALHFE